MIPTKLANVRMRQHRDNPCNPKMSLEGQSSKGENALPTLSCLLQTMWATQACVQGALATLCNNTHDWSDRKFELTNDMCHDLLFLPKTHKNKHNKT